MHKYVHRDAAAASYLRDGCALGMDGIAARERPKRCPAAPAENAQV